MKFNVRVGTKKPPDFVVLPTASLKRAAQACPLLESDRAKGEWIACCTRRFAPMANRIAGDDEIAKDALQTSWIKILQATNLSLGGPRACPWVAKVVANSIRDLQRQERNRKEVPLEGAERFASQPSPEVAAQERQLLELLREMVAMLPNTYRRVYELRMQEELSTKETAERLGITSSNVTTVLNRAVRIVKRKLRSRLGLGVSGMGQGEARKKL